MEDHNLAIDLVNNAYVEKGQNALDLVAEALMLDPNCIDAYLYLAINEKIPFFAIPHYKMAVDIGREKYCGTYLKKNKGKFWDKNETRIFLICMQQYAICLYATGRQSESIAIYEEILEINKVDNQGIRNQLLLFLIQNNEDEKFKKYEDQYKSDKSAFMSYTRALFSFKQTGDSKESNKQLAFALSTNEFVPKLLLSKSDKRSLHQYSKEGDKKEADNYSFYAKMVWEDVEGALIWLKLKTKK